MKRRFHFSLPAFIVMVAVVALGIRLAVWQLDRAEEKREWLSSQQARGDISLTLPELLKLEDPAWYRVHLSGRFDNDHNILLDNRMHQGVAGYHVLTPFHSGDHWVLVNRGWIPWGPDRDVLPEIPPVEGTSDVSGHTYIYSRGVFAPSGTSLPPSPSWPLRVQRVEMEAIGQLLGVELAPFEIRVAADTALDEADAFVRDWQGRATSAEYGPERHHAYALQWFLLAMAALGVYLAASFRPKT